MDEGGHRKVDRRHGHLTMDSPSHPGPRESVQCPVALHLGACRPVVAKATVQCSE
jgi:hypothetical protein